ncbi:MmyB family transcriptional regulator [Streptomyces spiralis]|uniref:MmyB family transcriptional regulator n=1 Tax=Streptomyces spiralis TaxID=66376 RepID=UPI00340C6DB1
MIVPRTEIVVWNTMGTVLITDFGAIPEKQGYFIRILITDPAMRELYADWEGVTRLAIAQMRMHNAHNPGDRQLAALVGELSVRDEQFRQW